MTPLERSERLQERWRSERLGLDAIREAITAEIHAAVNDALERAAVCAETLEQTHSIFHSRGRPLSLRDQIVEAIRALKEPT